ncbi:ABC transporter substrate-binding protein [Vibrio genomosp. F10 str. 9ZC157]|uniref:ABC transporter substrate-binding protein n=1 Tax=Vibrio genomosp. F10 str. ZF-129 TaxID=1187848 RepID=A0A1E5BC80_9VIBR|nr:ABC transporter substrate-binding protein [Vibrio genomosp. F10]OEE32024.1 ABC transporter substrate-binding protein [Vibrio genomosp. F10 str. ZF-129]OEE92888.1 ABC transporter substrate-binding protein [Vibrio genomosp. F10 str. 9ZC157]
MGIQNARTIIRSIWLTVLGLFSSLSFANQEQLVILTTFSSEPMAELIAEYQKHHPLVDIKLIHRRTQSAIQMLNKTYIEDVDVVLSSSPFLMQELNKRNQLATVDFSNEVPDWLSQFVLPEQNKVTSVGYSGAGLVWNNDYLNANGLNKPKRFIDLTSFDYFGHLTMSTPSRSGTTQMMIESILKRYGWEKGWSIILNVGANLGSISSRSFGVSDYVAKGQFAIGPSIDSYALVLANQFSHVEFGYDQDFTLMPTYVGVVHQPVDSVATQQFVELLLSKQVQTNMLQTRFSKHAIADPSLFSSDIPGIELNTVMRREKLVNMIFDEAITKRLPELQDAWFSLMRLKQESKPNSKVSKELERLQSQLFQLPISEQQVAAYSATMREQVKEDIASSGIERVMLAEFSYRFGGQYSANLTNVAKRISQLQQELQQEYDQ